MYLFVFAAVGLHCCSPALSHWGELGLLFTECVGFSVLCLLLLGSMGSALKVPDSRAQVQGLWHMGLAAPRHVESSQTRGQTCVPCAGRRILIHSPPGRSPYWSLLSVCNQLIANVFLKKWWLWSVTYPGSYFF